VKVQCRGSLPLAKNLCRSCIGLGWLARETTGFILRGYRVPEPSVLAVRFTNWSGEGDRSQVPGGGV
jgi:hypothetical protein